MIVVRLIYDRLEAHIRLGHSFKGLRVTNKKKIPPESAVREKVRPQLKRIRGAVPRLAIGLMSWKRAKHQRFFTSRTRISGQRL